MKNLFYIFAVFTLAVSFNACEKDVEPVIDNTNNESGETLIEISTDFGTMYIYLYKGTPLHRENFIKLVSEGFYDQTEFHRIIPNFMIQGGDPNSKDDDRTNDGFGGPPYTIAAEIDTSLYKHDLGAIAAARKGDGVNPERRSSGSQFYIVVSEAGTLQLNDKYTVFGKVIQGLNAAEDIVLQPRNSNNLPNTRIPMTMKILKKTAKEILDEFGYEVEQ